MTEGNPSLCIGPSAMLPDDKLSERAIHSQNGKGPSCEARAFRFIGSPKVSD
jgi:hypothetical protein